MAGSDRLTAIAAAYAEALLALGERSGQTELLLEELQELARLLEGQPELARELTSPLADRARRAQALERICRGRTSDLLADFLQVLNRRNRLMLLSRIAAAYRERFQRARGLLDVYVASAVPLDESERGRLARIVERRTGRKAEIHARIVPALLGGIVVRMGDEKFDRSIANELGRLEERLVERASREIIAERTRARGEARS